MRQAISRVVAVCVLGLAGVGCGVGEDGGEPGGAGAGLETQFAGAKPVASAVAAPVAGGGGGGGGGGGNRPPPLPPPVFSPNAAATQGTWTCAVGAGTLQVQLTIDVANRNVHIVETGSKLIPGLQVITLATELGAVAPPAVVIGVVGVNGNLGADVFVRTGVAAVDLFTPSTSVCTLNRVQ